ncbi:MAG: hypothetical protein K0R05_3212 [Anaerocolumna sp.]|nr:hypothetical protein [Anaerocolumna sp.]
MEVVFGVVFAIFMLLTAVTRRYEKDFIKALPAKEHPLIFLYPFILFVTTETERIIEKSRWGFKGDINKREDTKKLTLGKADVSGNNKLKENKQHQKEDKYQKKDEHQKEENHQKKDNNQKKDKKQKDKEKRFINLHELSYEETVKENLKGIYIGNDLASTLKIYHLKKWSLALFLFLVFDAFAFFGAIKEADSHYLIGGKYLNRPAAREEDIDISLTAVFKDISGKIFHKELDVPVSKKSYSAKEAEEEFDNAIKYLDEITLGNNTSADQIYTSLVLKEKIPDSHVKVSWSSSDTKLLEDTGIVHNEELKEQKLIQVTAILTLEDRSATYSRAYVICPKIFTEEELAIQELELELKTADKDKLEEPKLTLPEELKKYKITWLEKKDSEGLKLFLLGVAAAFLSIPLTHMEVSSKAEKRKKELLMDYPELINKFMMLINAGMSVSNAWKKLAVDYKKKGGTIRYAYEELALTAKELQMGISESKAYEEFGRRVKLIPYLRFAALLSQNIQKGSPDFISKLEDEALKAFEERKERAKKAGEEAGTKLLMPMMVMLVLVIIIILIPAMSSFQL